jgi:UDP-glucuronate 4-epimerase
MQYLVTGAAGFIGFHVAQKLLQQGHDVLGVDVVNDYYDPRLKESRLEILETLAASVEGNWTFLRGDLADKAVVDEIFRQLHPDRVIHLAAQAGVRHSLDHPLEYVQSNIVAFTHLLEACRHADTAHFVYASTSSVYGANEKVPFSEQDPVDHPLQFYAATKRANELMAHSYSQLFALPTTGLRFFTVYGPWGRPSSCSTTATIPATSPTLTTLLTGSCSPQMRFPLPSPTCRMPRSARRPRVRPSGYSISATASPPH